LQRLDIAASLFYSYPILDSYECTEAHAYSKDLGHADLRFKSQRLSVLVPEELRRNKVPLDS